MIKKKLWCFKKEALNFAIKCPFFAMQIDICERIEKITIHFMTKHVLIMPIKFEVDSLIC